ncbi:hypothetical protein Pst134EA_032755 [Puccinia striiformis f. sp. tritici]|uniref:uncharacterized protein n=1 Tax=Puccinia striiformis f. sp. tritici TaxID=168172 RepID=UPI002007878A|nr:uncharacterized protein Pst134EA_032755 [Puccinia striiformis f. sp. tritici]KAH9441629.1 hypothetical protein Pst134EA_032755 [Puccinia striiformis f. sp. tritici]
MILQRFGLTCIQAEINQLERLSKPTPSEQPRSRLKDAKLELSLILKAKEQKGIAVSDENRSTPKVIIDPATGLPAVSSTENGNDADKAVINTSSHPPRFGPNSRTMNWFGPDGKLLEPEKSFHYHPVFNPFGVPPPITAPKELGQIQPPPTELTETEDLSEKEGDSEDDSEEDESEEDSENDIPLPEGSSPGSESENDEDDDEEEIPLPDGPPPPKPVQKPRSEQLINPAHKNNPKVSDSKGILPLPVLFSPPRPNGLPLPPPPVHNFHSHPTATQLGESSSQTGSHNWPSQRSIRLWRRDCDSKPTIQASATLPALPQLRDLKREATSFVPAAIRKKRKGLDRRWTSWIGWEW